MMFNLKADFLPTGDQPQAIEKLAQGISFGLKNQVLLGVTGSGKTFTMGAVIQKLGLPSLIISHNKTLAGQLYQEFRDFFPDNAVSYFVSYYDYYQPEAYLPQTDTYIEKEAQINDLIDKLRLRATANILSRPDVIVIASVSCIYNIGSALEWGKFVLELKLGQGANWQSLAAELVKLHYTRSEFEFTRGAFRLRGDYLDIYPAYEDFGLRIKLKNNIIRDFIKFEPVSGQVTQRLSPQQKTLIIYPAKHYLVEPKVFEETEDQIRADLEIEYNGLKRQGKQSEAERLLRRVNYDLELIKEVGYVSGIENYSRYFDGRAVGASPYTLLDYFQHAYGNNFLVFIDESHMTLPQLRGMHNGDLARKKTLVEFGFRLKAAFDNRPLRFEEFYKMPPHLIYVSATPDAWEINQSQDEVDNKQFTVHTGVVEQLVRPTGIPDPKITLRPAQNEVEDLIKEIGKRVNQTASAQGFGEAKPASALVRHNLSEKRQGFDKAREKILVTTLTKKTAEDLADYLKDKNIRAQYLHSDIKTLERSDVLDNLRRGAFDVLIGVNLLREGLDLPEVTLMAILDADREGFLRSKTSLIQLMGRAARNVKGEVIIYADHITDSIKTATEEVERRRAFQLRYNQQHGISPETIQKPIREKIIESASDPLGIEKRDAEATETFLSRINPDGLTAYDKKKIVKKLEKEMKKQAENLNFELAIKIRDRVRELKN